MLVVHKASPTSLSPNAPTLEADWPATLAGYPSTAAVAKPFRCRSSSAACIADDMQACLVLIESPVCHVAPRMTRAAHQPELSMCTSVVASSRMNNMHLMTGVLFEEPLRSNRQDLRLNETLPWRKARCLEDGTAQPERYSLCAFDSTAI